jgi:hypothetical protein
VSACAAILAILIALLTGGSPTAGAPTTGAPAAAQTSSSTAGTSASE